MAYSKRCCCSPKIRRHHRTTVSLEFTSVCGASGKKWIDEDKCGGEEEGGKPIAVFGEKPGGYSRKGVDVVEGVEGLGVEEGEDGAVVLLPQEDSIGM